MVDELINTVAREAFSYLETEWGYIKSEQNRESIRYYTQKNYIITYTNLPFRKKIEVALLATSNNIEIYLSGFDDNLVIKYDDPRYCIRYDQLYLLLEPPILDKDLYSIMLKNRPKAIEDAAKFIKLFKTTLCSNEWFNSDRIQRLEREDFERTFKIKMTTQHKKETVVEIIRRKLTFLIDKGYTLILDSKKLPPYDQRGWVFIYAKENNRIIVSQIDPRDYLDYNLDILGHQHTLYFPNYSSYEDLSDNIVSTITTYI